MRIDNNGKMYLDKVRDFESAVYINIVATVMFFCLLNLEINAVVDERQLLQDAFLRIVFYGALEIFFIAGTIGNYNQWKMEIKICDDGIWRKLPRRALEFISWDEFQEICVCHEKWGTRRSGERYYVVIYFVKHGVRKVNNRWPNGGFSCRKVISMDYTYELHEELKEKCPLGVLDLRDTPEYAIK